MVRHDFHQFDRRSTLFEHYLDGGGHRFFGNRPNLFSKLDNSTYLGKHFNFTSLCISRLLSRKIFQPLFVGILIKHPRAKGAALASYSSVWKELCIDESLWMLLDDVLYMVLSITLSFSFVLVCDQPSGLLLEGVLCCHIVFFYVDDGDDDIWKHLDVVSYQQESLFPENCLLTSAVEKILFKGKTDH